MFSHLNIFTFQNNLWNQNPRYTSLVFLVSCIYYTERYYALHTFNIYIYIFFFHAKTCSQGSPPDSHYLHYSRCDLHCSLGHILVCGLWCSHDITCAGSSACFMHSVYCSYCNTRMDKLKLPSFLPLFRSDPSTVFLKPEFGCSLCTVFR